MVATAGSGLMSPTHLDVNAQVYVFPGQNGTAHNNNNSGTNTSANTNAGANGDDIGAGAAAGLHPIGRPGRRATFPGSRTAVAPLPSLRELVGPMSFLLPPPEVPASAPGAPSTAGVSAVPQGPQGPQGPQVPQPPLRQIRLPPIQFPGTFHQWQVSGSPVVWENNASSMGMISPSPSRGDPFCPNSSALASPPSHRMGSHHATFLEMTPPPSSSSSCSSSVAPSSFSSSHRLARDLSLRRHSHHNLLLSPQDPGSSMHHRHHHSLSGLLDPPDLSPSAHARYRKSISVCGLCGKDFKRPSALRTHMVVHSNDKPYQCEYAGCDKRFNVKSNMLRHMRKHGDLV